MLSTNYNALNFSRATDINDVYKTNLPEIPKLRALIDNSKLLFSLPSNRVFLDVAEGENVYRINLLMPNINKLPFGFLIFIPGERRLDIYSADDPGMPLIQFKGKKAVYKGYSTLLDRAGLDQLFSKLSNVL